jgi:hypothetical protein
MAERIATVAVYFFYLYAALGFLFALAFVWHGVSKVDRQASGTSLAFRCLIFPGVIAFWPMLLRRWLYVTGEPPEDGNPHR